MRVPPPVSTIELPTIAPHAPTHLRKKGGHSSPLSNQRDVTGQCKATGAWGAVRGRQVGLRLAGDELKKSSPFKRQHSPQPFRSCTRRRPSCVSVCLYSASGKHAKHVGWVAPPVRFSVLVPRHPWRLEQDVSHWSCHALWVVFLWSGPRCLWNKEEFAKGIESSRQ